MNYYLYCMRNYTKFSGRAGRAEFWLYVLISSVICAGFSLLDVFIGTYSAQEQVGLLGGLASLIHFVPGLAATVRRLHDTDHSPWWILINCIPLIGTIWYFILLCKRGTPSPNRYGSGPEVIGAPILLTP